MKKLLLSIVLFGGICLSVVAQGTRYDEKLELGNGLYKVKSGEYYGLIDGRDSENDRVLVSIEYQDIIFNDGKALLTKDNILWGIVSMDGSVMPLNGEYMLNPKTRYIQGGFFPVSMRKNNLLSKDKWGYLDSNGEPFRVTQKIKGSQSLLKKTPTLFDDVVPFVEGMAVVKLQREGWKHVDSLGKERFVLNDLKSNASFRSSVYKGESVIVTENGIKLYQEVSMRKAAVKQNLTSSATFLERSQDSIKYKEGTLILDSLLRVVRFESPGDTIVFIKPEQKIEVIDEEPIVPVDTLSLEKDLRVQLVHQYINVNTRGEAVVNVKVENLSNERLENLNISINCNGISKEYTRSLESQNGNVNLPITISARFSSEYTGLNVRVIITYKGDTFERQLNVTVKRYTPVR